MNEPKKIVIVGGGFGGLRAALDLEKRKLPDAKIILVSDKPHFEYHPALYRVVTGRSPLEVCVPLREIFHGKEVELVEDLIVGVNLKEKTLMGKSGSRYQFDFLVLALGSETTYFGIPGLKEFSLGFKSIPEALRLKRHLHEIFEKCKNDPAADKVCAAHILVVGGGASGVEVAGELAVYTRKLARDHGLDPGLVAVCLIEAAPRLLPMFPEEVSARADDRLRELDVNIFTNRAIVKEETQEIHLKDMNIKSQTLIWTAGVKPNHLYSEIQGFELDKKGRVLVDEHLEAKGFKDIFVIGDAAATPYSGLAQTAISDGRFAAEAIASRIENRPLKSYEPKKPSYALPIGPGWAVVIMGGFKIYGKIGWWIRRAADLRYFLSVLPLGKAILAFRSGKTLCESCAICLPEPEHQG